MDQQSDQSLVESTRQGDRTAYEILVERYYRRVYAVCLSVVADPHTAQDICQETMLRGLLKIKDLKKSEQFAGWIVRIARNLCIDHIRSNKRWHNAQKHLVENQPESNGQYAELIEAILKLPVEEKMPLMMFYFDGKNSRVIAESLEISHSTVCRRIRRAKERLYELLNESEYKNASQTM